MRIALVYDCLSPYSIGGAERWYAALAERLAAAGHEIDYLTLRQWPEGDTGQAQGARVVAVGPQMALYAEDGRRRMAPPLAFGLGVLLHLLRHGRNYDVVHTASFPFFSLLAAAIARPFGGYRIVVDWHEVWSRAYWKSYLGPLGAVGWLVQNLCMRVPQKAFCFAEMTARRLKDAGVNGPVGVLTGEYAGPPPKGPPRPADPLVVFAGRLIPEKRAIMAARSIALARMHLPELKGVIYGDGPEKAMLDQVIVEAGAADCVTAPGFVDRAVLEADMDRALCLLHPSSREGYGLVVVEAAVRGAPTILVQGDDNAALELIEPGVNGEIAVIASAAELAKAIWRVHEAGDAMRQSTAAWYAANEARLSLDGSLQKVVEGYSS